MVIAAIVSLILGVVCGQWLFSPDLVSLFGPISEYTLYILMFAVGISVGANKQVFRRLRQYHVKILIIPAGIVVGTVLAGFLCYLIVDMPLRDCLAVVCGLGWYSLSGVLLTNLAGATLGTMAFFSNLLREILSFLTIHRQAFESLYGHRPRRRHQRRHNPTASDALHQRRCGGNGRCQWGCLFRAGSCHSQLTISSIKVRFANFLFSNSRYLSVIAEKEIHTKKGKPSAEHPLNPDDDQNHPAQYLRFISQHIAKLFADGNGEKATD